MADTPAALHGRQVATRTGDRLPLRIYVEDPGFESDVLQAIDLWNHAAGVGWLELTHDPQTADRIVHHGAYPGETAKPALARAEEKGRNIWIPKDAGTTYAGMPMSGTIAHELGHTFGLDHPVNPNFPWFPATDRVMWWGDQPQPGEVAQAAQGLGQAPVTDRVAMDEARVRGQAVTGQTRGQVTNVNQGAPFAWYNEKIAKRFSAQRDPAQALASQLVFASLVSRWRVDIPEQGIVAWQPESASYTYHHYVQDVNQLATALKSSSARRGKLAAVDKGQMPASSGRTTSRAVPSPSAPARPSSKPKAPTPAEQHGRQLA